MGITPMRCWDTTPPRAYLVVIIARQLQKRPTAFHQIALDQLVLLLDHVVHLQHAMRLVMDEL